MNSTASRTAPSNFAFNFCTSLLPEASDGLGPSSFFLTGAFGAPGAAGVAAVVVPPGVFSPSDSLTAATRDFLLDHRGFFSVCSGRLACVRDRGWRWRTGLAGRYYY